MPVSKLASTNTLGAVDAKMLAMMLQSMGRGNDTILAHITPREARKLKKEGGRGSINPETGLLEFDDEFFADFYSGNQTPTFDIQTPTYGPEMTQGYDAGAQTFAEPVEGGYTPELVSGYNPQADLVGMPELGGQGGLVAGPTAGTPLPQPGDVSGITSKYGDFATSPELQKVLDYYGGEAGTTPEAYAAPEQQQGLFSKLTAGDLLKGALAGGTGLMGYLNQQRAMDQAKRVAGQFTGASTAAAEQVKGLASPYLQIGGTQLARALQGQLDPGRLRQLEIMRAQLAQAGARSGGVGAIQTAAALERARQDALTAQQDAAFKILGPGNDLAYKALMMQLQGTTGGLNLQLQLSNQAQQAATNLYAQIGRYISGV